MREITKIGSNIKWISRWGSYTPYCSCGTKLNYGSDEDKDNYCKRCGSKLEWYLPYSDED